MKTKERIEARRLRSEGRSMKEIARLDGVALSSVSCWTRDIELSPEQCRLLRSRNPSINGQLVAAQNRERGLVRRKRFQSIGRAHARRRADLHVAGCMLYWAEGSKGKNAIQFVNSDPAMARYFVGFLRTCYAVRDEAFRVDCNLFADHIERQRDRAVLARHARAPRVLPSQVDGQRVLEVQPEEAEGQAAVRHRTRLRALDGAGPADSRRDSGVRRLRAA
jgi:hypothetical protein